MPSTPYILVIVTLLAFAHSAELVVSSSNKQIVISSEQHLSDLVLTHLGQNSGSVSDSIKKYIEVNKLSLLNAVEEVALVFVSGQAGKTNTFDITDKFVKNMGENMRKLTTHFLVGKSETDVQKYLEENLNGKKYEKINVDTDQITRLQRLFTSQGSSRLLEQTQQPLIQPTPTPQDTSFSYITKFFFSIMFILVTFGILASIASMDNRKDSLLYAKFLTDVSGR